MFYLPTNSTDATELFALEEWIANQAWGETTLLLWSTAPTIMIGKYQDALAEENLALADQYHLAVTRRKSGGGTIYTDPGSLQYSLIAPKASQTIDFSRFLNLICKVFRQIGVPVECSDRNDLLIKGRKFSGNAQYNLNGYVIHHGSLLFDTDLDTMAAALQVDQLKLISKHISSVHQRVINLKEVLPYPDTETFKQQFLKELNPLVGGLQVRHLTTTQKVEVAQIRTATFANSAFIYDRVPTTLITKKRYFPGGGLVKLSIAVEHGVLSDLKISGDFFSNLDPYQLTSALLGRPFRPEQIRPQLEAILEKTPIYHIQVDDLINLLFG